MKKLLFILLFAVLSCKFLENQKIEPILYERNESKESLLSKIIRVTKDMMELNIFKINRKIISEYLKLKDTKLFNDLITAIDQNQMSLAFSLCKDEISSALIEDFLNEIKSYHDLAVAQIKPKEEPQKK